MWNGQRITWGQFEFEVKKCGLEPVEKSAGHWQIKGGALLVNFYPDTKKGPRIYVAGTTGGYGGGIKDAIAATHSAPVRRGNRKDTRGGHKRFKRNWIELGKGCHWCNCKLTMQTATIEHLVPLKRGGLDNENNMAVACEPCNRSRGHEMPELKRAKP